MFELAITRDPRWGICFVTHAHDNAFGSESYRCITYGLSRLSIITSGLSRLLQFNHCLLSCLQPPQKRKRCWFSVYLCDHMTSFNFESWIVLVPLGHMTFVHNSVHFQSVLVEVQTNRTILDECHH